MHLTPCDDCIYFSHCLYLTPFNDCMLSTLYVFNTLQWLHAIHTACISHLVMTACYLHCVYLTPCNDCMLFTLCVFNPSNDCMLFILLCVFTGCPHIYHDEKSRQYPEYQEELSENIKTFNWNYFINSLGKHTLAPYQYDFLYQSQYFAIVAAETNLTLKTRKHNFNNSNN